MNSLKGKKSFYVISSIGCGFFTVLLLMKILKNLATASVTEIAIVFILAVCAGICATLLNDKNGISNVSTNKTFGESKK